MLRNVAGRLAIQTQVRCLGIKNVDIKNKSADMWPGKGQEAAKGPVKVHLEAGKQYSYCNCGFSIHQPFCDGSHGTLGKTLLRPIRFTVDTAGDYIMCQCKQSNTRPICDGSHRKLSPVPPSAEATILLAVDTDPKGSPVYKGVAKKLGYRSKNGYQQ